MNQAGMISTSVSTTTMISGSHLFNISGHSITKELPAGKCIMSSPFVVGGYQWAIMYYPNGLNSYDQPGIAFTLELQSEGSGVEARLEFCLVDSHGRPSDIHKASSFCEFGYVSCNRGFSGFITHEELEESWYLRNDSFVVKCTVGILDSSVVEASGCGTPGNANDTHQAEHLPPSDLHEQLRKLLESGEGADVEFNVDGQIFSAHRCILAARSPVFHAQFFGPIGEKNFHNIEVEDMEAVVFKVLLQYLYTDVLPDLNEFGSIQIKETSASAIMAQHLLAAADRYSIERLKMICEEKLLGTISIDTVATTLALAEQHGCGRLNEACIEFLSRGGNLKEVMDTDGFGHLMLSCPSMFNLILANINDPNVLRDLVIRFSKTSIKS
ncbi:BTB/POZ and MATH domain-containing protein 2 [Rhynchospora pubera]|uniref:BTB/POZ and MATH domain-containing protein 2 n=1 Tax=Rhynchospora pubera TaxID=906938 RepID=A0AAV8HF20_9POAL|nr:BTB/POZ and MATH domain-containing protein 2 [Rhynchospora pubera]